jgi:SOS-response transcriptional repressor LexA
MSDSPQIQLHPTALRIYRFIIRYKRMHAGDSPSRREIAAALDLESINTVQNQIENLETAGLIKRPQLGHARRIVIPGASWEFDESLICAKAAGSPGLEEGKKVG